MKHAFIAVEDKRFYRHFGIDFIRIGGALLRNIRERSFVEGGSTITQQLAKMLFLSSEKTVTRKIKEIFLSLQLERIYTKDTILGLYLNHAYLGTRAYGIGAAAHTYFGRDIDSVGISEAALLATLPKAPSRHSPFKDPKQAVARRNAALRKMRENGFLNEAQFSLAVESPMPETLHGRAYHAPYFVDYMRGVLEKRYGDRLYTSGLKIYSTLDSRLQQQAEDAVRIGLEKLRTRGVTGVQAALLAADLHTGKIRAMVGGRDYGISQFNRATQALRQPGSAFKPIVYLAALKKGYRPDDMINDERIVDIRSEGIWVPQNYNGVYMGKVSLQKALSRSLNAATVNLARMVGIQSIIDTAEELGISNTIHPFYSSALGASEVTLLELVCAYGALGTGHTMKPIALERVIDRENMLCIEPENGHTRLVPDRVVMDVRSMLKAVVLDGTGRRATTLHRSAYGKTGTTNDYADAWFIGFDEALIAGVWVGRDDRSSIGKHETGSRAALPIWLEFMKRAGEPQEEVVEPLVVMQSEVY